MDKYTDVITGPFEDYNDYKKFSIGTIRAIGVEFKDVAWLDIEHNIDILRPVHMSNMAVRDLLLSINLGIIINVCN